MLSILPDAAVTTTGMPVTINVLANDAGDALTITSFSKPANGSLVFNADKSFTYTPTGGFVGDDGFSYMVRDGQGTPASIEVTISVLPNDGATIATDDIVEVVAAGDVIIPVLANDMVAGDGSLQISAVSVPSYGAVNVLPDQTIRYVPQSGFVGIDSFNYTISDEAGRSATATVIVKVLAKNNPPLAADDTFPVEADQPTLLALLSNDSDPEGGPLQIVGFTMPSHGSLVFNSDKTFTYTPTAGYLGQDQFTYTIRDNRGDSALATVTLVVAEIAESPAAYDDQVTTEAGQPVTIDVLANDILPEGKAAGIIAVTLPFKGKLDFNSDKTITYTSNAGFVGSDDFTYTIGNGQGGTAKARVMIEVTPASIANVYTNGYAYRRRLAIPASSAKGNSHQNFPLWVELADSWLKSTAYGGKVASVDGHDLRFELTDGTKLAHELERYDAASGTLRAWVRLLLFSAEQPTSILLYYGKVGLAESEAEPEAVWQDYLAVWHLPEADDRSGHGRDLVVQGNVGTAALGLGAGSVALDGAGVLKIDDVSWLNNLDAVSVQFRSKAASIGHDQGQLNAGVFLNDRDSEFGIRYQSLGWGSGNPVNLIHTKIKTSAGNIGASSPSGTQTTDWQSIGLSWQSGELFPTVYLDGLKSNPSYTTRIDGPATTTIDGPLYIGAGPVDTSAGGWVGHIDEVRFRATKLDPAWIEAEHINHSNPDRFFGVGAEEVVTDSGDSLVALPVDIEMTSGEWIDIDVFARALLPQGTSGASIEVVSQPLNGNASVVGNKIRYSSASGFAGTDSFTYKLVADRKSSTALITLIVAASKPANQDGMPRAKRLVNVSTASQLTSALVNAEPGDHIILANGTYPGSFTLSKSGTAAAPIVVRSANPHNATIDGRLDLRGNWGVLYQLRVPSVDVRDCSDCRISRCYLINGSGIAARKCPRLVIDYNEIRNYSGRGIELRPWVDATGPVGCWIHHNYVKDQAPNTGNAAAIAFSGGALSASDVDHNGLIEYNLAEGNRGTTAIGAKCSGMTFKFNTCRDNATGFDQRHGRNSKYIGNSCINSRFIAVHGIGHQIIGNYSDVASGNFNDLGIMGGSTTQENFVQDSQSSTQWPRAENCLIVGNFGPLRIGSGASDWSFKAKNNIIENHTGPIVLVDGRHEGTIDRRNQPASVEVPEYVILQPSDVGPLAA